MQKTDQAQRIPISITPTFHHDIAYLRPEKSYTPDCFEIIDEALRILEADAEYRFTVEQAWLLEQYWNAKPAKRALLCRFAAEGRLSMAPGLYAVPDMNLLDGESLFMQATVGKAIVRDTLGLNPRACLIADSWGHPAQLPQILSQCGYAYYGFSRCMRRDVNVENFRWKGLDGSEL
ncbi:MAG TPA: alpha-mannosidase, partial [Clostridia bacterium]|nr:alpha-mannosidase [Clostridia bacterium]